MAIDFCIAKNIKEASYSENYVNLTEKIHDSIKESKIPSKAFSELILQLDPYGDKLFSSNEIKQLIEVCDLIKSSFKEKEIILFSTELRKMCILALKQNKLI
ncbi:hypothetical protein V7158_11995, partial [Priestia megaterium]|uniref:hypothetical protein n=1 Tax=Priestia megaterium TaxID=1404 RepID=UPI002FFEF9AB